MAVFDKRTSLQYRSINYRHKKFCILGPSKSLSKKVYVKIFDEISYR